MLRLPRTGAFRSNPNFESAADWEKSKNPHAMLWHAKIMKVPLKKVVLAVLGLTDYLPKDAQTKVLVDAVHRWADGKLSGEALYASIRAMPPSTSYATGVAHMAARAACAGVLDHDSIDDLHWAVNEIASALMDPARIAAALRRRLPFPGVYVPPPDAE